MTKPAETMFNPADPGTHQVMIEQVFQVLLTQTFADWYNEGLFFEYITGENIDKCPSKGEVLESLFKMIKKG